MKNIAASGPDEQIEELRHHVDDRQVLRLRDAGDERRVERHRQRDPQAEPPHEAELTLFPSPLRRRFRSIAGGRSSRPP